MHFKLFGRSCKNLSLFAIQSNLECGKMNKGIKKFVQSGEK